MDDEDDDDDDDDDDIHCKPSTIKLFPLRLAPPAAIDGLRTGVLVINGDNTCSCG